MAQIKSAGTVDVTLTIAELELIRRALKMIRPFGDADDWQPADYLLADLEAMPS